MIHICAERLYEAENQVQQPLSSESTLAHGAIKVLNDVTRTTQHVLCL